jgi:GST-like protein
LIELFGMSSPNVTKVLILLEELGLPYEARHVDVFKGPEHSREIADVSPFGKVPVIRDHGEGGLAVFESGAILIYLAERYGGEAYMPAASHCSTA